MTKTISILLLLTFLIGSAEAEQRVLAIQSIAVAPYEQAIKGFEDAYGAKTQRLLTSALKKKNILQTIRDSQPDVVLAVGRDALLSAKEIKTIPVVYCMVLNPRSILSGEKNIRGVSMNLSPAKQLHELSKVLPAAKNIGLLYDPDQTGIFVQGARQAALKMSVNLTARQVRRSRDVSGLINEMKGQADIYWMLPDTTVITPETIESLLMFSFENNIPILTFSEKYLELGAMLSIGIDAFDIGSQAGEMARKISSGINIKDFAHEDARKALIVLNAEIARKFGITIEQNIIRNIKVIR
ncbi:MAG: ABC transporter substrate binding protein [Desulfobacterales bacterium]|nr:ABC transporter substrate binding protein [Desulfobacterales bacterium]